MESLNYTFRRERKTDTSTTHSLEGTFSLRGKHYMFVVYRNFAPAGRYGGSSAKLWYDAFVFSDANMFCPSVSEDVKDYLISTLKQEIKFDNMGN